MYKNYTIRDRLFARQIIFKMPDFFVTFARNNVITSSHVIPLRYDHDYIFLVG